MKHMINVVDINQVRVFGVECVGSEHVEYLLSVVKAHYEMTTDWGGSK